MLRFFISETVGQKQNYTSDSPKALNENIMIQEAISQLKRATSNHPKTRCCCCLCSVNYAYVIKISLFPTVI